MSNPGGGGEIEGGGGRRSEPVREAPNRCSRMLVSVPGEEVRNVFVVRLRRPAAENGVVIVG